MEKVVEVMRIKRIPPMGKLVVEVGNQQHERLSQLPNDVSRLSLVQYQMVISKSMLQYLKERRHFVLQLKKND
jgi:hypothetical protein